MCAAGLRGAAGRGRRAAGADRPAHADAAGAAARPAAGDVSKRTAEFIAVWFDKVATEAEGCDAVVASGLLPALSAARSAAEKLGIPSVQVSYCPVFLPSPYHPPLAFPGLPAPPLPPGVTGNQARWDLDAQILNKVFGEAINTHRMSVGLPPTDDVRTHVLTGRPWLAADQALAPWPTPADLGVVQTGAWILPDERPLPDDLAAFLDAGAPPVYVGLGSMRAPEGFAEASVAAVRAQDRRVVIGRGWAGLAQVDDRDDCLVVDEVNQQALFGRVAAVVHHGGAGTTTTAGRAGTPQVVVPQASDQPYWAGRVADLGIGAAHDGPTPTVHSLTAVLGAALAPQTRERAAALAGLVHTDGTEVAATLLLDAVSQKTRV